ncbi:MAG: GAF domain-containing protein [Anaerolineae bacterium]
MRDTPTNTDVLSLVQEQGDALLNAIAHIASGNTDFEIEIPEGIETMSNIAIALTYLAEDVADRIKNQNMLLEEMELRVQERTQELAEALESLQKSQQKYLQGEWSKYFQSTDNQSEDNGWLQSNHFRPAAEQTILEKVPAMTNINGNGDGISTLTVPINFADNLVGLLGFEGDELEAITDDDLSAIEEIAEQVGLALENQRLFDQTQDALAETQTLYQISARLNEAESVNDIISAVVETITDESVDTARFWLTETLSDGSMWLEIAGMWDKGQSDPYDSGYRFEYSENNFLVNLLQKSKDITLISSMEDDPRTKDEIELLERVKPTGLKSFAYLPLLLGQRLIGLFVMSWKQARTFDESDSLRFAAIGAQVATAFDGFRSLNQTRLALAETQSLYQISARLNASESTSDIVFAIHETLTDYEIDEIILWQVRSDSAGQGLQITMVETYPEAQNLDPRDDFFSYSLSDYPFLNDLLTETREVLLVSSIQEDPRTIIDPNYLQLMSDINLKSMIYLPLLIGSRLVGLVTLGWRELRTFNPNDSQRFSAISAQIATAKDSLRLLDQTQQALSETQALYQISARLNAAESAKEIVDAVVETVSGQELDGARLWLVHEKDDDALLIDNVYSWFKDQDQDSMVGNSTIFTDSETLPYLYELLQHSRKVRLISSLERSLAEEYPDFLESLKPSGYTSMAFIPLSVGSKIIGLFTFGWNSVRHFDELEYQYYTAIGAQIATTVEGLRLLDATRLRAEQLEKLTTVETALSAANSEDEILSTIANTFSFARGGLHYIDQNSEGLPSLVKTVSIYENGKSVPAEDLPPHFGDVNGFLAGEIWLKKPSSITMITNTEESDELSPRSKEIAATMKSVSFCTVPLHSGRSWQGVLTLSWPSPHTLTPTESFLLENLREPLSAIVARHRSQIAAQKARQESERLYDASRRLNEASSDLNKIVEAVTSLVEPIGFDKTVLSFVRKDSNDKPIGLEIAAFFQANESDTSTVLEVGQRFGRASYERAAKYSAPFFIENIAEEKELSAISKDLLDKFQATSVGLIPLSVGTLEIGFLFLLSSNTNEINESNKTLLNSLSPQIAVAVQNSLLFDAAEKRADREFLLREISEKVRNTSDVESVMRTAVTEIGRVLGRKTFLYLKSGDDDTNTIID